MMARQAGKNELSAHLEAFLLNLFQRVGGTIVKAAPTFRPQARISMRRLEAALDNPWNAGRWEMSDGHILRLGRAQVAFMSAAESSNVVGSTASILLEIDEAQAVSEAKYDRDFRPMGATANVTTVLYGTAWSTDTLLEQVRQHHLALEASDGVRRHFAYPWMAVAEHNPDYGRYVEAEIARLGEQHPIIRTQYLLRSDPGAGRFLSPGQLELIQGDHLPQEIPDPSPWAGRGGYVAGIDVAGEDEEDPDGQLVSVNLRRDSTVLTIAFAEDTRPNELIVEPRFHVVRQYLWRGTPHRQLYPTILELVRSLWRCRAVVVDATGVGGGLAAFLGAALGPRIVIPFKYTAASKSQLAYDFLAAVNGGRFTMYSSPVEGSAEAGDTRLEFFRQAEMAEYRMGLHQRMTFFVPSDRGHDDLLNAAALLVQASALATVRSASGRRSNLL